ncbi:MAG: VRR-NUC domain-containing protein [Oscillospiraceae bacterium]|nr:VRR-NUC domain-containing protein [Oscillospiraceae bacterium]
MQHIEDNEQILLFDWATLQSAKYPELGLLYHIPNGGKRDAREAARFKRMGVKPGVPDLFLPVPRGKYHGLYIEMKSPGGKLSDYQKEWLEKLSENGYAACVCFGFEEAQRDILKYLGGKLGENS